MYSNVMRGILMAVASALVVSVASAGASGFPQADADVGSVKVLSFDGRYIEVDPASGRGLASGRFEESDHPRVEDVLSVPGGSLFALLGEGEQPDENGQMRFRIASLDRETLKTLHSFDLPKPQDAFPILLLDPSRNQLLLSTDAGIQILTIRTDGSIQPIGPLVKMQRPIASLVGTYIDSHGDIVDGISVSDRKGRLLREVRPDSVLDAPRKKQFASLTLVKGTTQHFYGAMPAASAGDRIVFVVGWDDSRPESRVPQAGITVYDLNVGRIVSSFFSKFPVEPLEGPPIQLSPDGRHIVISQYRWLPYFQHPRDAREAAQQSAFATGKLAIYDAGTGSLTGTVDLGPASDPYTFSVRKARAMGYSPDGSRMYYWFNQQLSVIDLDHAKLVSKTTLPAKFDPVAAVDSR